VTGSKSSGVVCPSLRRGRTTLRTSRRSPGYWHTPAPRLGYSPGHDRQGNMGRVLRVVEDGLHGGLKSGEDVSQVLIPDHRGCPNSYRLMNNPITRSCMRSVLEKQIVRRTSRLIRVRRLMCLLSIFGSVPVTCETPRKYRKNKSAFPPITRYRDTTRFSACSPCPPDAARYGYPLKAGHHMPQWFQASKAVALQ
jgi:hypothetical protein